ncbi:TPA: Arc family DNA-binding protein [Acinetobacter nosocomialis]|nr:Arc family DNA-binding protein [Acinetobacter nosocomialis]
MARNDPQMNLRVPMDLKEKIEKAAFDNGRTITAEAVYRLEQSFEQNSNQNEVLQKMEELLLRLEKLENKGI